MPLPVPHELCTNGEHRPLGVGARPLLTWAVTPGQKHAHVKIRDGGGRLVWDSAVVDTDVPEVRVPAKLSSRATYHWQVRVADQDLSWSPWSAGAEWECPLLVPEDWEAQWIARPVDQGQRIVRSLARGWVDWIGAGESLAQTVTVTGMVTAVNVDLVGHRDTDVHFAVELEDSVGRVIAVHDVNGPQHLWDRFMHFIDVTPAAPPGTYTVRLQVHRGEVGWHTAEATASEPDDGVSPLPLVGQAFRGDLQAPGVRAVGVDTIPAPNPIFRKVFELDTPVRSARLHAVGLGCGVFTLNGTRIGDEFVEPAPTDFDRTVLYRSWDVTQLLQEGHNEIGALLGRGHYAARGASIWGWHLAPWHREPTVIAQLEVMGENGVPRMIGTGADWQTAPGAVIQDILFSGETWSTNGEQPKWAAASVVEAPAGELQPATLPPIRTFAPLEPLTMSSRGSSVVMYDFGVVVTGRVRCIIRGTAGSSVRLTCGEALSDDGAVLCTNQFAAGPSQVDVHYLDTQIDGISWEPEFGYRGFRWVEVATTGDAVVDGIHAVPMHTDVAQVGAFFCDEPVLKWIDSALPRTFLNNLHGIPTDTPIYEKNGWTADAHLATEAVLHHLDLRSTFTKWLNDHADAQDASGVVPQIIPTPGWAREADPAWSASAVLIPWHLYWEYGDIDILQRFVPMVVDYADALSRISGDGLWPLRSWGDWLAPGFDMAPEGSIPTATMMMRSVLQHTARILRCLNQEDQAEHYDAAADRVARAYHDAYFDTSTGTYGVEGVGYRQTMNVLPLAFDAVPPELVATVVASLVADIEDRTQGHLDCGAVGVRHLLPVLTAHGREDLALTIATQRTRPGWGVWFEAGEKTLLESWDADARSRNHYFLGSAASWVQQKVGGMRTTRPGWAAFEVKPIYDGRIREATIRHRTVRGEAAVKWTRTDLDWDIAVSVPPGSTATVAVGTDRPVLGPGAHRLSVPVLNFST